jgi:hypothetical protein
MFGAFPARMQNCAHWLQQACLSVCMKQFGNRSTYFQELFKVTEHTTNRTQCRDFTWQYKAVRNVSTSPPSSCITNSITAFVILAPSGHCILICCFSVLTRHNVWDMVYALHCGQWVDVQAVAFRVITLHDLVGRYSPCGGGLEYLHRSPASRKRQQKGTQCRGFNWATLFLGDINTGTWPSKLGESQIRQ